jgi:mannosylglycerate hydrolase MGH1-like protein
MTSTEISADRHWSTWDAARPAEFMHLPSGVRVTPVAYAASTGHATAFPPGPNLTYGAHDIQSRFVALELEHAGTRLALSYCKLDPLTLLGAWTTKKLGEWGLRFWFNPCLGAMDGTEWRFDPLDHSLHLAWQDGFFVFTCREEPLLVTAHADLSAHIQELDREGYWHLASRADHGRFLAVRFNLDHAPENRFAITYGESLEAAKAKARNTLAATLPSFASDDPLSAARDIVAWNTVWDAKNRRSYTSCSRNWDLSKFGGFGIWLTDTAVSALIHSLFGLEQARENLEALLAGQTEHGNFPCLLTGKDSWLDRSQPPIVSLVVWQIYRRTGARELAECTYGPLLRNHQWWWRTRDGNGDGFLEYGSSPVGQGLYRGTKLAAKNESFMDNSPVHDEAHWIEEARTLDSSDVGLNSLIALDAEMLACLASVLGRDEEARTHRARAREHAARLQRHFWDESRGIFANRLWSGKFIDSLAPTSFFPLLIGAADRHQISSLRRHLADPASFGGAWVLPSVARSDRAFAENVYWRGRIWPILNWLVWLGLKRAGLTEEAQILRLKSAKLFDAAWKSRLAPENFNATTGEPLDQPDTDPFYSWTALLPLMATSGLLDVDPWQGWCLQTSGEDGEVGPMCSPWGPIVVSRASNRLEVSRGEGTIFWTNIAPRITQFGLDGGHIGLMLPANLAEGAILRTSMRMKRALQKGHPLQVFDGCEIHPALTGAKPERLEVDLEI